MSLFSKRIALFSFFLFSGFVVSKFLGQKYGGDIAPFIFYAGFLVAYVFARVIAIIDKKREYEKLIEDLKKLNKD